MEVVPSSWKRLVAPTDQPVDRRYYTLCVLERLHEALRRHDVFVEESTRWGDPRAKLLSGEHWERVRPTICQSLGRKVEPKMEFDELARRLDEAYRTTAARFPQPGVRLEKVKNKAGQELDSLVLTGLDKVEEPESLRLLRHRVARRQPLIDLPELLLEIQARTGFASEFSHISEGRSRLDDLAHHHLRRPAGRSLQRGAHAYGTQGDPGPGARSAALCAAELYPARHRFPRQCTAGGLSSHHPSGAGMGWWRGCQRRWTALCGSPENPERWSQSQILWYRARHYAGQLHV